MRFEYLQPLTLQEATSLLAQYDGEAKIIAGGTDLINLIQTKAIRPRYVSISALYRDFGTYVMTNVAASSSGRSRQSEISKLRLP